MGCYSSIPNKKRAGSRFREDCFQGIGSWPYRVMILGSAKAGKLLFLQRFLLLNTDRQSFESVLHVEDVCRTNLKIEGSPCMLDIFNTSGCEEFPCLQDPMIREAEGFILCFDLESQESLVAAQASYKQMMRARGRSCAEFSVLCGLKTASYYENFRHAELLLSRKFSSDDLVKEIMRFLVGTLRGPLVEGAKQYSEEVGLDYFEASVCTDENVNKVFERVTRRIDYMRALDNQ